MNKFKLLPVNTKLNIGILGGTFNPAHLGHKYLSEEAIKRLNLDYVIWLVSPQNPLKSEHVRDLLNERVLIAKTVKCSRRILVSDVERYFKDTFTVNTLVRLKKMHPYINFIWLMGADNMINIHKWYKW